MIFLDGFANPMEIVGFDHIIYLLKACFERFINRKGPFVFAVLRYGVSGIIVSCYNARRTCRLPREKHQLERCIIPAIISLKQYC